MPTGFYKRTKENLRTLRTANTTHGQEKNCKRSRTASSYWAMLMRCKFSTVKHPAYKYVYVCKRWKGTNGLIHFIADLGLRPKGTTLGRYLDSGDYKPSNCRWMSHTEQRRESKKKQAIRHFKKYGHKCDPAPCGTCKVCAKQRREQTKEWQRAYHKVWCKKRLRMKGSK
jgi:hypothetical protein